MEATLVTGLKGMHVAVFDVTGIPADDAAFHYAANKIIDAVESFNCAFNIDAERLPNGDVRFNAQMCLSRKGQFNKHLKALSIPGARVKLR